MSGLNSLFNRATFGTRCKTCLNLAVSRIKLLHNRRELQLKTMRKEIAQFLHTGQEAIARIKVEHVIREQNISAAYEIIELFCEFLIARIPIIEAQRDCPSELLEAVASIIFASPRCSDLPELLQIHNLFTTKYGKEFVSAAAELRPDSCVNRAVIEKLSARAPSVEIRLKVLKEIAKEYNLQWDSSYTEKEFSKKHEDLLDGSVPIPTQQPATSSSSDASASPRTQNDRRDSPRTQNDRRDSPRTQNDRRDRPHPIVPAPTNNNSSSLLNSNNASTKCSEGEETNGHHDRAESGNQHSDAMERAQAALAVADHALAAAREAAELKNVRFFKQLNEMSK